MIEGFWIRNFRAFKRLGIGSCFELFSVVDGDLDLAPFELGPVTAFVGGCGIGKSTIFDAFSFIADCFHHGLDFACQRRGGFENILHQEAKGSFSVGIDFRLKENFATATYAVGIGCDRNGIPFVESEILVVRQEANSIPVIFLQNGAKSIRYLAPHENFSAAELTKIEFTDYKHLGLVSLVEHPGYPAFGAIRDLFDNWQQYGLTTDPLGGLDGSLSKQHSPRGRSLSGLVRFIVARYGDATPRLLERIARFLPNVEAIFLDATSAETPKLTFKMTGLRQPIPLASLPGATIRLFAYALLLEEDHPAPLIAIKEPESGFDQPHLENLLELIRRVIDFPRALQLFISTRTPELFETLPESAVWCLEKRANETFAERICD